MAVTKESELGTTSAVEHIDADAFDGKIEAVDAKNVDAETSKYASDQPVEIDAATNKRLYWKINKRILWIMLVTYCCQSLDKGSIGFSSIMGIQKDANLKGQEFSWLGTILYFGILTGEYPQNFLLQKLPVGKFLALNIFLWGATVSCLAASKNFASLMAVRYLLGFFESVIQPSMVLITSMWYTREEQPLLTSLWYCQTGVQLMIGGLVAFGISHFTDGPIYSWQLLFLTFGLLTAVWAVCVAILLPDSPMKAKCFSEEDKRLMIERVRANETGIQNKKYKMYQVKEAFADPFVWLCVALITIGNFIIGGLGFFSNLIVKAFGFSLLQTQLLNIAQGAVTIAVMIGSALLCQKTKQTCLIMVLWSVPAIIGTGVILGVKPTKANAPGMLIAFYCTQFFLAEGNMIISLVSRNIAGQTKKGVCLSMTFVGWAVGNMIAPQIFQASDAPRYLHGFTAHICIYGVYLALVGLTRWLLMKRNATKRAACGSSGTEDERVSHENAFADLTDRENKNFRYCY